ncbi:MAG: BCCT family transporter, partial [Actinobacteria bacterium]|nr:BCCT family transporter [Actinomycetota bacterium]
MPQTPDEPALHSTTRRRIRDSIHPRVFGWSAAVIVLFVVFAASFPETAGVLFGDLRSRITDAFGWFFILAIILFLGFCAWLALGPYARVRLGPDDSTP